MGIQQAALALVAPAVLLARLVAARQHVAQMQVARDLFRTPLPTQQTIKQRIVLAREALVPAGSRPPPIGPCLKLCSLDNNHPSDYHFV